MRAVIFFSVLSISVCLVWSQDMTGMPKYDERYDYLDVDAIFTNKRLVRAYVDCLINSNRCTPEGKALKRILPEALRTKCVRCTERQKRTAVKIIRRLKYEYPDEWAKLEARWDPTGDFTRYFEEYLAKESFNSIPGSGVVPLSVKPPAPQPAPAPAPRPAPAPAPQPAPAPAPQPAPAPAPQPAPLPEPVPTLTAQPTFMMPSTNPVILNRFGDDGEMMMGSPSSGAVTPRPTTSTTTTMRPTMQSKPTSNVFPTRYPLRPASNEIPLPYSTAITFIDQIGFKIIRTTELVTDLLRNTVRAVVG